ncbi:hypothetical protein F6X56_14980 [Rhodococcus erythropolis]|uniref:hypothetical protein n=1 Tax=Rhodococcus erythropolis TaxID=1833 RepID=UPI00124879D8|nr:hypothetical protein [Rhodococcus erythropolis]QEX10925.1 hypothetical protein F6X56_14980 [Rhodococcus erythropolis]
MTKTQAGAIRASDLKAIQWFTIKHGVKPSAISAYPNFSFVHRDGSTSTVHLGDILDEYDEFKRTTHGKHQAAA